MSFLRRTPLGNLFGRETLALPVDIFRLLVGLLSFAYFLGLWREAADISGPDGLIDHALVQDIFWFTRLGLFHPGMGLPVLQGAYLLALAGSVGVILGWHPKPCAGLMFAVAVSAFRWNFLTAYVEDGIIDLMIFWLLLLPVGRTLTLADAWRDPRGSWARWLQVRVPGTALGCFLCNVTLVYLIAGGWKWTSPMWRDGSALYAVLKLPISHAPDYWGPAHLPLLKLVNWSALGLEPLFPLALLLRRGHPLKWLLLAGMIGFHGGIVATMRLPLANLACLAAGVLIFREELMAWLARGRAPGSAQPAPARLGSGWCGRFATVFIIVLTLAMVRHVPAGPEARPQEYTAEKMAIDPRGTGGLSPFHQSLYGALWLVGLAQQYQLFDWIDLRNRRVTYEVVEIDGPARRRIDPVELFPATNRSALLQCYLHDLRWLKIPADRNEELKRSLALRFAQRYCRTHAPRGTIVVTSCLGRITAEDPFAIERGPAVLFSFRLQDGAIVLRQGPPDLPATQVASNTSPRPPD